MVHYGIWDWYIVGYVKLGLLQWGPILASSIIKQYPSCTAVVKVEPRSKSEIKKDTPYIDELMQERVNFIANALELRLSCNNPPISQEKSEGW